MTRDRSPETAGSLPADAVSPDTGASTGDAIGARLPALGPHGEGWVLIQVLLLGAIALAGAWGGAWSGDLANVTLATGLLLIVAGGLLAFRGLLDLGHSLTPVPMPTQGSSLVERGAYRFMRHPIYTGLICGALGWGLARASLPALVLALALLAFFDLKSRREEAWLVERYPAYAGYRARTRRIPSARVLTSTHSASTHSASTFSASTLPGPRAGRPVTWWQERPAGGS